MERPLHGASAPEACTVGDSGLQGCPQLHFLFSFFFFLFKSKAASPPSREVEETWMPLVCKTAALAGSASPASCTLGEGMSSLRLVFILKNGCGGP